MNQMEKRNELKAIFDEALQEFPDIQLPPAFTDALLKRIENRLAWREWLAEFGLKMGLVIGVLTILAAVLFFPGKNNDVPLITYLENNWQIIAVVVFILFFTFFFDQVFLRFLFHQKRS